MIVAPEQRIPMHADYSKQALTQFLKYVGDKGLLNPSTAQARRVAVGNILVDLSPAEEADVRKIDLETAFRKFVNRNGGKFTPKTLSEYRRRAEAALADFAEWTSDPAAFKPRGRSKARKGQNGDIRESVGGKKEAKSRSETEHNEAQPVEAPINAPAPSSGLPLPFPVRPDFLAQIVIPRDLTVEEAKRMSAFIMTLAVDFKPQ